MGDPADFTTDTGPVIDADAQELLQRHLETLSARGQGPAPHADADQPQRPFFARPLAELKSPEELEREVFGPILHIVRYDSQKPETVTKALAARGYGLTLGVHSRLEAFADSIMHAVPARQCLRQPHLVGAVVGVQPFGGEGPFRQPAPRPAARWP